MDNKEFALQEHEKWAGKIEVISRAKLETPEELAVCYTPGVAEPCIKISEDVNLSYKYTRRHNMVAVVTDGTAVLGLGRYRTGSRYAGYGRKMLLCLRHLAMWTHFRCVCAPKMWTRS